VWVIEIVATRMELKIDVLWTSDSGKVIGMDL